MKLKKIVSLALAGILAVSMLTACGNGNSNNEPTNPPAEDPTPASVIADALNDQLSNNKTAILSFESNSKLASLLNRIATDDADFEFTDAVINAAGRPTLMWPGTNGANINAMVTQAYSGTNVVMRGAPVPVETRWNNAYLYVYMVSASVTDPAQIADDVINGVGGLQSRIYNVLGAVDNAWDTDADDANDFSVDYEYTGYAEMVKVVNSNTSSSAWLIGVLVEQDTTTNT